MSAPPRPPPGPPPMFVPRMRPMGGPGNLPPAPQGMGMAPVPGLPGAPSLGALPRPLGTMQSLKPNVPGAVAPLPTLGGPRGPQPPGYVPMPVRAPISLPPSATVSVAPSVFGVQNNFLRPRAPASVMGMSQRGPNGASASVIGGGKVPTSFGSLRITISGCKNLPPTLAAKADRAFVKARIGDQPEKKTSQAKEGGPRPRFGDELTFEVKMERECEITLCHPSDTGEQLMGSVKANIMPWIAQGSFAGDLELKDSMFQPVGQITLNVKFERNALRPATGADGKKTGDGASVMTGMGFSKNPQNNTNNQTLFTDEEIKEAFTQFDLDRNGFVGAAEIRHILINIGESVTDDEVDEMVRMVDRDGDGMISFPEFYRLTSGGREMPDGLWNGPGGEKPAPAAGKKTMGPGAPSQSVIAAAADKMDTAQAAALRNNKRQAIEEMVRRYNISGESVKRGFSEFESLGKVTDLVDYASFCDILALEPSGTIERVFNLFDGIGDEQHRTGQINFREFAITLMNFTSAQRDDKTKFSFQVCDQNGDGKITKDELVRVLKSNHMVLNEKEVERKAETIMAQADANNDGGIGYDEFLKVTIRFPNIIYPSYIVNATGK